MKVRLSRMALVLAVASGTVLAAGEHGDMKQGQAMDHGHSMGNGMGHGTMDGGATPPDTRRAVATEHDRFFVVYTPLPDPVPVNQLFQMRVDVYESPAREQRVTDARVSVEAGMPQHGHGMNTAPVVTPTADGGYLVEGMKFHMPGTTGAPWRIVVRVEAGGRADSARFHVVNGQ